MNHAIVRIFDDFEHAEQARLALLDQGFGADAVELDSAGDEAGTVKGNFVAGNNNYARPGRHDHCIMKVTAADAAAAGSAAAIVGRFGARDLARQTPAG
jgi:hypothetical protein